MHEGRYDIPDQGQPKSSQGASRAEKIAALEDVQGTEDEISAKYQSLADAYKMEFDAVKSAIGENAVIEEIKLDKAYKLVKDSVVYTEEEKAAE